MNVGWGGWDGSVPRLQRSLVAYRNGGRSIDRPVSRSMPPPGSAPKKSKVAASGSVAERMRSVDSIRSRGGCWDACIGARGLLGFGVSFAPSFERSTQTHAPHLIIIAELKKRRSDRGHGSCAGAGASAACQPCTCACVVDGRIESNGTWNRSIRSINSAAAQLPISISIDRPLTIIGQSHHHSTDSTQHYSPRHQQHHRS